MRANISVWQPRFALLVFFSAYAAVASAQTPPRAQSSLEGALLPGSTAWITDSTGREEKTRIVSVSDGVVTTTSGEKTRRIRTSDVRRVDVRRFDSVLNGALIGAGVAVASGLLLCTATEPWENCRDDVGPMMTIGAIGAGVGIGIDALIRGRRTIYEAPAGSTRLSIAPIVGRHSGAVKISLRF